MTMKNRDAATMLEQMTDDMRDRVLMRVDPMHDDELDKIFREAFDDVEGPVAIGMLVYSASEVLEAVDEIAYRTAFSEFLDGNESFIEINGEYYDADELADELEAIEEEDLTDAEVAAETAGTALGPLLGTPSQDLLAANQQLIDQCRVEDTLSDEPAPHPLYPVNQK